MSLGAVPNRLTHQDKTKLIAISPATTNREKLPISMWPVEQLWAGQLTLPQVRMQAGHSTAGGLELMTHLARKPMAMATKCEVMDDSGI